MNDPTNPLPIPGKRWIILLLLLCASLSSCWLFKPSAMRTELVREAAARARILEAEAEAAEIRLQRLKEALPTAKLSEELDIPTITEAQWERVTRVMEAALKDAQADKGKR